MTVVEDFAVEVEGLSKRFSDEEAFVIEGLDFRLRQQNP